MNQVTTPLAEQSTANWVDRSHYPATGSSRLSSTRYESDTVEKIEQTIGYMMDHLDQPLQVTTLAAMACVSPSHYFALFKRRTGCAPMDYFTRLRMEQARKLLDSTSRSVKEVAAALGYDDPFYFSRVFKAVNRVAPSYYRQQQLAQLTPMSAPKENSPSETSFRPFLR